MAVAVRWSVPVLAVGIMALGLFQLQADSVKRIEIAQAAVEAQAAAVEQQRAARTEDEHRRFEQQLSHLAAALNDFQQKYNASGGQVWPKKEADALKKAIQALHLK